ncbi:MAG: hypothetical protein HY301_09760 [Verrucomicrobia bacterium]|nr:hypothetical protein [Verrucomicrobiota bacterium]
MKSCFKLSGGRFSVVGAMALLFAAGGCATDNPKAAAQRTERDKLMWDYRKAATAMRQGNFDEARALLDDAVTTLNAVRTADSGTRKARSLFGREEQKTFLGEPYERVMAFYYRGILYWMQGEPDNARACYRSAAVIDGDPEKKYGSDYVLLDYLDGYVTAKLGGDGSEAHARAEKNSAQKPLPPYDKSANVVVFGEFGRGPTKFAAGRYGEQLKFLPGNSIIHSVRVTVEGQQLALKPLDDLYFQATTRGGRVMDHILGNKAVFKSTTDAAGNAAIIAGSALIAGGSGSRGAADEVGLGLLLAGLVSKVASSAATPEADTRQWYNLPQYLTFTALRMPPGPHTGTVEFLNATGQVVPNLNKQLNFTVYPDRDTVIFFSDQNQ